MRRADAGKGSGKAIFSLLVLAFVAYASVKIVPVYLNNYELQTYLQDQTPFWLIQRVTSDGVRDRVLAKARDLDLPISKEQVQVEAGATRVTVNVDYTVPIDLKVYTLTLHFTPHSENRAL